MKNLVKQEKFNAYFNVKFTKSEMRGLSKQEKELIRSNNYSRLFIQEDRKDRLSKIVLFIEKDNLDKKKLYGMAKWQITCPNKKDIVYMQGVHNYCVWLLPFKSDNGEFFFYGGEYEVRIFAPQPLGYLFGHTTKLL